MDDETVFFYDTTSIVDDETIYLMIKRPNRGYLFGIINFKLKLL